MNLRDTGDYMHHPRRRLFLSAWYQGARFLASGDTPHLS
jgi:hypothetical protein